VLRIIHSEVVQGGGHTGGWGGCGCVCCLVGGWGGGGGKGVWPPSYLSLVQGLELYEWLGACNSQTHTHRYSEVAVTVAF
jgi:hypothetical protein